jgi:hypothetical protein
MEAGEPFQTYLFTHMRRSAVKEYDIIHDALGHAINMDAIEVGQSPDIGQPQGKAGGQGDPNQKDKKHLAAEGPYILFWTHSNSTAAART